jgi:hypothetical protein
MTRDDLKRALQAAVVLRLDRPDRRGRADAAVLESALDVLEAAPIRCDEHAIGGCAGLIYQRVCADCGKSIARCETHGGRKSVSRWMWLHRESEHAAKTKEDL